jgi:carbonic anhydrase
MNDTESGMCDQCDQAIRLLSRRRALGASLAFAGAAALTPWRACAAVGPGAPNAIPPAEALARLTAGNARYAANAPTSGDSSAGRAERADAQYPIAAIVSCADSRVTPERIFDQGPGQLFVTRVAGNFVDPGGLASLEYGVKYLGVPLIIVLGHSNCGAIAAAIKVLKDGASLPGHLPNLVADLKPGVQPVIDRKPKDLLAEAIRGNVRYNVAQLRTDQPIIAEAVANGNVKVVGGVYDIASGKVALL